MTKLPMMTDMKNVPSKLYVWFIKQSHIERDEHPHKTLLYCFRSKIDPIFDFEAFNQIEIEVIETKEITEGEKNSFKI